jgi:type VI secretion system protein ImpA
MDPITEGSRARDPFGWWRKALTKNSRGIAFARYYCYELIHARLRTNVVSGERYDERKLMATLDSTADSPAAAVNDAAREMSSAPEAPPAVDGQAEPQPFAIADPAVAALCTPLDGGDPCGPDLDVEGDADYLNFFAQVEGVLPASFFDALDGTPFDRASVDIPTQLEAIKPLLARTRDLRLLIIQARLQILDRDLAGFSASVAAVAYWLDTFWDQIHPRAMGGGMTARSNALSVLEAPTVIFPLQYAPLFDGRRIGAVSYRSLMIANDEVKPRNAEAKLAVAAIVEARGDADPQALAATRNRVALLKAAIEQCRTAFAAHGESAGLENLPSLVAKIQLFIDPAEAAKAVKVESGEPADGSATLPAGAGPESLAQARDALAAIARYYSSKEPSSPALPLVRHAHLLIGKSFIDVIRILVPDHLDKAAFQIGGDLVFQLPVGKLSGLSAVSEVNGSGDATPENPPVDGEAGPAAPAGAAFQVNSRGEAIALLDQVQRYFRASEPSSPVPMLCQRARSLAERDFMAVLRDVLPKAALKSIGADD